MGQEIRGTVAADGNKLPFATVMLLRSDSSFVAGTMTGEEGQFTITDYGVTRRYRKPIGFVTFNQTFQFPKGWLFSSNISYNTAGNSSAIYWKSNGSVNVSLSKSFLHNSLNVQLQGTDLLHTNRIANTLVYGDRGVEKWNKSDSRQLLITVRYQLNTAKSKYKGVSARGTNKNRL